jgi:hypothetical protein
MLVNEYLNKCLPFRFANAVLARFMLGFVGHRSSLAFIESLTSEAILKAVIRDFRFERNQTDPLSRK